MSFYIEKAFYRRGHAVNIQALGAFRIPERIIVLALKSQNIPEVVVVRRGAGGVLGSWKGDGSTG